MHLRGLIKLHRTSEKIQITEVTINYTFSTGRSKKAMHNFPLLRDRSRNHRQTTRFQHTATLSQRIYGVQRRQFRFQDIVDQLENRFILASDTEPNVIGR